MILKISVFLVTLFIPAILFCETTISLHVGGSTYCDEEGCFGPSGIAYGGTFTRALNDRWSLDVDATLACTWEDLPERLDDNGMLFIPERERTRFWTGVAFLRSLNSQAGRSHFYVGAGIVAGHEWQKIIPKAGGSYSQKSESGVKAGVSAIAGYQFRFTDRWAVAPEVRFYLLPDNLSALRYSAVLSRSF
jgi:opacity protein-like surface antigen